MRGRFRRFESPGQTIGPLPRLSAVAAVFAGVAAFGNPFAYAEEVTFAGISARVAGDPEQGCSFEVNARSSALDIEQFSLNAPPRLVVDLKGDRIPRNRTFESGDRGCVTAIRFGVQPHGTRVVFDLVAPAPERYDATTAAGRFRARFMGVETGLAERAPSGKERVVDPESASRPPSVTPVPMMSPMVEPTAPPTIVPTATMRPRPSATSTAIAPLRPMHTATPKPPATKEPTATSSVAPRAETAGPVVPPSVSQHAALKFKVDRVVVEFKPDGRPVENIVVTNTTEETLQMSAKVRAVESPGHPDEREVETKSMLVSPLFFSLESGASRQVRLVGVEDPEESEQVFRVTLFPGRSMGDPQARVDVNGKVAELSVVTAFAVTVLRAPEGSEAKLTTSREGPDLVVRNDGLRSVALTEIKVCRSADVSSCHEYPARRLYAGNSWRVPVSDAGRLEILQRVGKDFQTIVIEGAGR